MTYIVQAYTTGMYPVTFKYPAGSVWSYIHILHVHVSEYRPDTTVQGCLYIQAYTVFTV